MARHPTRADVRWALRTSPKKEEAELLVRLLREPHAHWINEMAAEFIERECLAHRPRRRPRKDDAPYSFRGAHVASMKRLIFRRVLRVQQIISRHHRPAPGKLLGEALVRVAEEIGREVGTVRRYYYVGRKWGQ
jgi:hypothetical protein